MLRSRVPLLFGVLTVLGGVALLFVTRDTDASTRPVQGTDRNPEGVSMGPTTDLTDGQVILVRGDGLPPSLDLLVAPCGAEAVEAARFGACDLERAATTRTDGAGSFSVGYRVSQEIRVIGNDLDCAEAACVISVLRSGTSLVELTREPVSFLPADGRRATLTVRPRSDLSHLRPVTVTGTGFAETAELRICVDDLEVPAELAPGARWCDPASAQTVRTEGGRFDRTILASRYLLAIGDQIVDCAVMSCWVEVTTDMSDPVERSLWFTPDPATGPGPGLLVAPAVFTDRAEATVLVGNLLSARYDLALCTAEQTGCRAVGTGSLRGPLGASMLVISLPRRVATGAGPVDCAAWPGRCVLRVAGPRPGLSAEVSVSFDPTSADVTPFVRLVEGALEVAALADQTPSVWLCEPGADAPDGCTPAERTGTEGAVTTWVLPACPAGQGCELIIPFDPAYPPVKLPFGLDPGA